MGCSMTSILAYGKKAPIASSDSLMAFSCPVLTPKKIPAYPSAIVLIYEEYF